MPRILALGTAAFLSVLAPVAWSEDAALIIQNDAYRHLPSFRTPFDARSIGSSLGQRGFDVHESWNGSQSEMVGTVRAFSTYLDLDDDARIIVYLSGHFATTTEGVWLLEPETGWTDGLSVPGSALPVNALMELLADHSGRVVVVISDAMKTFDVGEGVQIGNENIAIPQGVTLIRTPRKIAQKLMNALLTPGQSIGDITAQFGNQVSVSGYAPPRHVFVPATEGADNSVTLDGAYFEVARDLGTIEALLAYAARFPRGQHLDEANRLVREIREKAAGNAKLVEDDLGLTRADRRRIQENLTVLGYNTRGIDGVFGGGSRLAIKSWQRAAGQDQSGYLTGRQIADLERQAETRRDRIALEEERKRAERDAQDRAYWRRYGADGTEQGKRDYLQKFPNGLYADLARDELAEIEARREGEAAARERRAWNSARETNTIASYRAFLRDHPNGRFAKRAQNRLRELSAGSATKDDIDKAKAAEQRLMGNPLPRLLAEKRLEGLGFNPGRVDGGFDETARRAISAFQAEQKITQTGYIDEKTLRALLP